MPPPPIRPSPQPVLRAPVAAAVQAKPASLTLPARSHGVVQCAGWQAVKETAAQYVDATNQEWLDIAERLGMEAPKRTDLGHGSKKKKDGSLKADSFMSRYIEEIWAQVVKLDISLMDVKKKRLTKAKSTLRKNNL